MNRRLESAISDESYNMLPVLDRTLPKIAAGVIVFRFFNVILESSALWINSAKFALVIN